MSIEQETRDINNLLINPYYMALISSLKTQREVAMSRLLKKDDIDLQIVYINVIDSLLNKIGSKESLIRKEYTLWEREQAVKNKK